MSVRFVKEPTDPNVGRIGYVRTEDLFSGNHVKDCSCFPCWGKKKTETKLDPKEKVFISSKLNPKAKIFIPSFKLNQTTSVFKM